MDPPRGHMEAIMARKDETRPVYEQQHPEEARRDRWSRESFTFRRMGRNDIVLFSALALVLLVLLGFWVAG